MYAYYTERNYKGDLPYTDLATERHRLDLSIPGVEYSKESCRVGEWERIKICSLKGAESIGRPMGLYHTLNTERMDMIMPTVAEDLKDEIASELCRIFDLSDIFPGKILVAGLGNKNLTPDAIGAYAAEKVKPTIHIKEWDRRSFTRLNCAEIGVITPGVAATSGLDAAVTIKAICDLIRPDAVVVIDALASRSVDRLGSTVQICNTGISPGSGLGNPHLAITADTVGVPVIAIGVPTVIDSRVLCGSESDASRMFVSPKEINEIVSSAADIIGGGINRAFGIYL